MPQETDDEEAEKHAVVAGSLAAEASRSIHGLQEIFGQVAARLPGDSLYSLMAALAEGYPQTVATADDAAQAVLCLELGVAIALRNVWRSALVAPFVFQSVRRGLFLHPCCFVPGEEPTITMEERMLPGGEPARESRLEVSGAAGAADAQCEVPQPEWALRSRRPAWLLFALGRVREFSGGRGVDCTDGLVWPGTRATQGTTAGVGSQAEQAAAAAAASAGAAPTEDVSKAQLAVWLDEEARMERAHLVERAAVAAMRFSTRATEACDRHSAQTSARRARLCLPASGSAITLDGHQPAGYTPCHLVPSALFNAMASERNPVARHDQKQYMDGGRGPGSSATEGGTDVPASGAGAGGGDGGGAGGDAVGGLGIDSESELTDALKPDVDRHVVPFLCLLQLLNRPVADILAPRVAAGTGLLGSVASGTTESVLFWRLVFDTLKGCTRNFYAAPLVWEALRRSVSPEVARLPVCPDILRTMLPLACPPSSPALGNTNAAGSRGHSSAAGSASVSPSGEPIPAPAEYASLLDYLLDEEAIGDLHDSSEDALVTPVDDEAAVGLTAALVLEQRSHALLQARVLASRALGGIGAGTGGGAGSGGRSSEDEEEEDEDDIDLF